MENNNREYSCAEIQLTLIKALLEIDDNSVANFRCPLLEDDTRLDLIGIENELTEEIKTQEQGE